MDKLTSVSSFTFYVNNEKAFEFELSEILGFTVKDSYGKEIKYVRKTENTKSKVKGAINMNVKKVRPKNSEYEAVYVTEDNIKDFLDYAFPEEYKLDTLVIDKSESPYIYAIVEHDDFEYGNFRLNEWYVGNKPYCWDTDEYFEDNYEISQ